MLSTLRSRFLRARYKRVSPSYVRCMVDVYPCMLIIRPLNCPHETALREKSEGNADPQGPLCVFNYLTVVFLIVSVVSNGESEADNEE